ncbi:nitrite reductase large subunit NirB [Erwiniaceae bacterium BAC15a-03b]|uniref:Nitrite reductase large subunit NirB n=1 Tax=Winslowiella arboricola TaxID=2978220 RepID=A0A9J6PU26_9GAMM|nr:nitrite reductase large subunit NirB [Winslowiella arboricola]MCU5774877.1 nitrite reductase large subunit NirB [Winslowiella arboricola]MCU5779971.1 nitrite reductase large subunit NirB [Winslowiella arboricola]
MVEHLLVIGNGMAGMRMVETLLQLAPQRYRITVIGREALGNYNRIMLSPVLSGEKPFADTLLHIPQWYADHGVTLLSGETVLKVEIARRQLATDKRQLSWDRLVFATGSLPVMPPVAGIDAPHVSGFRRLADVEQMLSSNGPVVVLGGGVLGIEAAAALRLRGRAVALVHRQPWLLDRQLDQQAAAMLQDSLQQRGIACWLNQQISVIHSDSVTLSGGQQLPAERVVIATGVKPELALAKAAGLVCGRGIQVNGQLQTRQQGVYALGECCEIDGETFGLLAPCLRQAQILAHQLAAEPLADFQPEENAIRLKVTGIDVFSAGDIRDDPHSRSLISFDPLSSHYRRLLLRDGKLSGVLLYGDISQAASLMKKLQRAEAVSSAALFDAEDNYRQPLAAGNNVMSKPVLVVIGHGMVGHHFLEQLVQRELHHHYQVVVYGEERHQAYDRVHLSDYFAGSSHADLSLVSENFFELNGIELRSHCEVVAIDRQRKCIRDASGHEMAWDKLVLATGSWPFVPPIPGGQSANCFVYRTLDDLDAIAARAKQATRGVVIGGGLLGLEAANALQQLGLETHVVEFAPRLMAVQLDDGGAQMLRRKIEALGVRVHTAKETREITEHADGSMTLNFADGETLTSDLVLFSAGIRPRDQLARDAGLNLGPRGGIAIHDTCATSDAAIYAIGECALWNGQIFGLVAPGYQMARVLAATLAGEAAAFTGADMSTKLKLLGVEVASLGDAHGRTPGCQSYHWTNGPQEIYKKIVVSADGKKLLGGVLVGDSSEYSTLLQMMLNDMALPAAPETLILPQTSGAPVKALGVAALPDSAQICSCHNVSKSDICGAVRNGAGDMAAIKNCTKAATGCGGCAALVKQVMEFQLADLGVEVKKDVCEHFAWSRQELHHLIRVNQIKSFDQLLTQHGRGHGCEVCKPLVGSLLASCWNEYLLKPQHLPLQDTNDRYFANIQKDGTYSVVPRMPAGEVTPQGLIAIGQIAQRYNLYSKITGGQRIDLFGARLDQLPEIWQQLVEAGFETGHAYGKSLRTVKSCVGSTWCRYGVQDSTGFAIALENRYKGLRAPHKIKMAVSGCTRECAEAQSKDIGVIATDKGWNLYVCGNGGMKPRHADLFASDLDDQTLLRYVDRLLMFYVRTADRLQRTSVWMDNLEGGLDYLRAVVIEDSLGIGSELEQEMQRVVAAYQCEWQTTLATPDRLALFRPTVNSQDADETVRREQSRGQIRPATRSPIPLTELPAEPWSALCQLQDIPVQAGIGARLGSLRIALFRFGEQVFALDDIEPGTQASVISRGILGDSGGEAMVISPLYKQRFRLRDGQSIDNPALQLRCWPVKLENGVVLVANTPLVVAETAMAVAI